MKLLLSSKVKIKISIRTNYIVKQRSEVTNVKTFLHFRAFTFVTSLLCFTIYLVLMEIYYLHFA